MLRNKNVFLRPVQQYFLLIVSMEQTTIPKLTILSNTSTSIESYSLTNFYLKIP